jgi:hypothetical protein
MSESGKTNLAAMQSRTRRSEPGRRGESTGPGEVRFSQAEVDSIWKTVMAEAGQQGNDDFRKAFEQALRTRAMRKLFLFGEHGMQLKLATGPNWAPEMWNAVESDDGGIVLRRPKARNSG